jgi:spermidine/putrescine transport system permease protein
VSARMTVAEPRRLESPQPRLRGRRKGWVLPVYTGLVIVYLFFPIAVMILFGFNDIDVRRFNFTWQGLAGLHPEVVPGSLRPS